MKSKILMTAAYYLLPVLLIFSLILLFQGHNEPGGGFVGGLTAASGLALFAIAQGVRSVRKILPVNGSMIVSIGLSLILVSGMIGIINGGSFLESGKTDLEFPTLGKPGTALLFDFGVYCTVIGSVIKIVLTLADE